MILILLSILLISLVASDQLGDDCTPEDNLLIAKCSPQSKRHIELLEKRNLNSDTAEKLENLAKACNEEVECMAPIKCKSLRDFIDKGTKNSCKIAQCNAKLVPHKNEASCLKEYVLVEPKKSENTEKAAECELLEKNKECVEEWVTKTCGKDTWDVFSASVNSC